MEVVDLPSLLRRAGLRPIPFGGHALILMAVYVLLQTWSTNSLTMNQFIVDEDPESAWLAELIAPWLTWGVPAVFVTLGFLFWAFGWRRAFRRTVLVYLGLSTVGVLTDCASLVATLAPLKPEGPMRCCGMQP